MSLEQNDSAQMVLIPIICEVAQNQAWLDLGILPQNLGQPYR
ncbi:MAG: hypothetical protein V7K40_10075 [Nostoc sp.]